MPDPKQERQQDERLDALSEALARILRDHERMGRRLERIEAALKLEAFEPAPPRRAEPAAAPSPRPSPPPPPPPPLPQTAPPATETPELAAPGLGTSAARGDIESRVGLTIVNRVGVITLVLGIGFFFKWAVDNQWIGPAGRVELGVLAGLAALAAADHFWRKGQSVFAQGLSGAGAAILYLATYASFGLYRLVPQTFAFACMFVVTTGACALALRYASQAIAALGLAGAYLTPLLLSTGEDHPWFLFSYVLVLNLGALALARLRPWRKLEVLSFAATQTLFWAWLMGRFNVDKRAPAVCFAAAYYAVFSQALLEPLFLLGQASAMLALALIWMRSPGGFFAWELAAIAAGLIIAQRRGAARAATVTFAAFWAAYWFSSLGRNAGDRELAVFAGLTLVFAVFFAWAVWRFLLRRESPPAEHLAVHALNGAAYFGASYFLLDGHYHAWMGLLAAAVAAPHLLFGRELWKRRADQGADQGADLRPILLSLGLSLCFLTLAIPIQFTAYRITMAWSLEAAALTWLGARMSVPRLRFAAALLFGLVAARLFVIDSWIFSNPASHAALWNARFLVFSVAGAAALLAARWVGNQTIALAEFIGGHLFLLWGLSFEALDWAARTSAPGNLLSVQTLSLTILFAVYAVALVSIGVATRTAVNRVAGLALIAFVILKLYFFDVWQLDRIHRISAFVALGVLMLATSFLYSHFRSLIESWWKHD